MSASVETSGTPSATVETLTALFYLSMLYAIAAILMAAMAYQYLNHEIPCPLCILQRVALFGVAFGIVQNFRSGYSDRNMFMSEGAPTRFSVEFPSPLNQPVYGLEAWTNRTGLDRHSWWINRSMPTAWQKYLAQRSTALEPLKELIRQARGAAGDDRAILGPAVAAARSQAPTPEVGPRLAGH